MDEEEFIDETRTEKLHGLICEDVKAREVWLNRQVTWYKMRNDGLRRVNKPWKGCADLHFPLIDTQIEKFKPFYSGLLFGTEVIAQFITRKEELTAYAEACGQFFDYKLKQESNLEKETHIGIDRMLLSGHVPVKVYWDAKKKQLAFDAIDPTHCIVPDQAENPQDADRITIIHHYTPEGFKRDPQFELKLAEYGKDFVKEVTGKGTERDGGSTRMEQVKEVREGITHAGSESDLVIVWEIWEQTEEDGWWIHWISPLRPEKPLRASQRNPFRHGKCPIVRFDCEITEEGWYASRGIPEKIAPFEVSLCKTWNEKTDSITLYNRPVYTSDSLIPNAGNIRLLPGQIIPGGLKPVVNPGRPPISYDDEMNNTRSVAESLLGSPDFGIGAQNDKNDARTATEVNRINQQQSTGIQLRSKVFLLALRELLGIAWETLLQYDQGTEFFVAEKLQRLDPAALAADAWTIRPNASSENWDKGAQFQRAMARYQALGPSQAYPQGNPCVKQDALTKDLLVKDNPQLVEMLFQEPNNAGQTEYENEAAIIPSLLGGAIIAPKPEQDQSMRIKAIMDAMHSADAMGQPLHPLGVQVLQTRVEAMMQMLQKKSPQQAQAVQQAMMQTAQNVIPMQQQQEMTSPAPQPEGAIS